MGLSINIHDVLATWEYSYFKKEKRKQTKWFFFNKLNVIDF